MKSFKEIEIDKIKTISINERKSKVALKNTGKVYKTGSSFLNFLDSLPDILAVQDFRYLVDATAKAAADKRSVIFIMLYN